MLRDKKVKVLKTEETNGYKIILFQWAKGYVVIVDGDVVKQTLLFPAANTAFADFCELMADLPYSKIKKEKTRIEVEGF